MTQYINTNKRSHIVKATLHGDAVVTHCGLIWPLRNAVESSDKNICATCHYLMTHVVGVPKRKRDKIERERAKLERWNKAAA